MVSDMNSMFYSAKLFNANISSWDVASEHNVDSMFLGALTFNQSLCQWKMTLSHNATITDMFLDTSCPYDVDPSLPPGQQVRFQQHRYSSNSKYT